MINYQIKSPQKTQQILQLLNDFVNQKNLNIMIYSWLKLKSCLLYPSPLNKNNYNRNNIAKLIDNDMSNLSINSGQQKQFSQVKTPENYHIKKQVLNNHINAFLLNDESLLRQQSQFCNNLQSTDLYTKNQVFEEIILERLKNIQDAIHRMKMINYPNYNHQAQQNMIAQNNNQNRSSFGREDSFYRQYNDNNDRSYRNDRSQHIIHNSINRNLSPQYYQETKSQRSLLGGKSRNIITKDWKPRFTKVKDTQSLINHPHLNNSGISRKSFNSGDDYSSINLSRKFKQHNYSYSSHTQNNIDSRFDTQIKKEEDQQNNTQFMHYSFNPNSFSKNKMISSKNFVKNNKDYEGEENRSQSQRSQLKYFNRKTQQSENRNRLLKK